MSMETFRAKTSDGRILDYRVGGELDLKEVQKFFESKYNIRQLWPEKRHVVGVLEKDGKEYFLKVATSEGIGVVTKTEYDWNNAFNSLVPRNSDFWVPQNHESGQYQGNLFYFITDRFDGQKLAERPSKDQRSDSLLEENINRVIDFSELIQSLRFSLKDSHVFEGSNYKERYLSQTRGWFKDIPEEIRLKYGVEKLWEVVEKGVPKLLPKAKHGDFAPWHLMVLSNGKLGLIDGEHAMAKTVEDYDICYIIQRIFTVMQNQKLAEEFIGRLKKREYDMEKVKTVLASRAIGGFLDEYLALFEERRDFLWPLKFKDWVLEI